MAPLEQLQHVDREELLGAAAWPSADEEADQLGARGRGATTDQKVTNDDDDDDDCEA